MTSIFIIMFAFVFLSTQIVEAKSYFRDLDNVPWAVDAIEYLSKKEVVEGIGNNMFDPNGVLTRARQQLLSRERLI